MSQVSQDSTPYMSPRSSPTTVLAMTTGWEEDDNTFDNQLQVDDGDIMRWHFTEKLFTKPSSKANTGWNDSTYTPNANDRCNACYGCKSDNCLTLNDGYLCLNCDQDPMQQCVRKQHCSSWKEHLCQNYTNAVAHLNQSLKVKYDDTQVQQLHGDPAWFLRKPPAYNCTAPNVSSSSTVHSKTKTTTSSASSKVQVSTGVQQNNAVDVVALQSTLQQLAGGITLLDGQIKTVASSLQQMADTQQTQGQQLNQLEQQVTQQQKQQEELGHEIMLLKRGKDASEQASGLFGESLGGGGAAGGKFPFNIGRDPPISQWSEEHSRKPKKTENRDGNEKPDDPVARLASILERSMNGEKHAIRLPAFNLPKIVGGVGGDQLDGSSYYSWKQRCQSVIEEQNLPDNLALGLIQNEQSLPQRYRAQIANTSTIQGCWTILDSMFQPKESLLPQLIRDLTSMENAWDQDTEIAVYDKIILKLQQILQHFPSADIDFHQLTAVLSCFSSAQNLNAMPDTLVNFKHLHDTTGAPYVELLRKYCQKRRADLHSIVQSIKLYRSEHVQHNNVALMDKEHYSGGTKDQPMRCHICDVTATHKYFTCKRLALVQTGKTTLSESVCPKCIRPRAVCARLPGRCWIISWNGSNQSLLCAKHQPPQHWAICTSCTQPKNPLTVAHNGQWVNNTGSDTEADSDFD